MTEGSLNWMPMSDINFTADPFLPGESEELLANGQFNKDVQVIIGSNSEEGMLSFFDKIVDPSKWEKYRYWYMNHEICSFLCSRIWYKIDFI